MREMRESYGDGMSSPALALASRRVFLDGGFTAATVLVRDGRIAGLAPFDPDAGLVLPDDEVLLPGLVDSHVHLNEPGRTDWEGFETGTAAAAAGGITTVVDMPLNSLPVTTTVEALAAKRAATPGKLAVDVAYWGGAVPENLGSLHPLFAAGVVGVKCFLSPSGIDEFGHLDAAGLESALTELAAFDGLLIAHAEDPAHLHDDPAIGSSYARFLASRPPISEESAIAAVAAAAGRTGARAHIVHVSDGHALDVIREARAAGIRLTAETCPHYLTLRAEDLPDGSGTVKCCPPVRDGHNQDLLWEGLLDGTIDAVVSDHSPATRDLKEREDGDLGLAWGGISGVQTGLRAVWTEASRRGIPLETVLPWFTTGPAAIAGIRSRGVIRDGAPAHLVAFAPDAASVVRAADLEYRNKLSPWDGALLRGAVRTTWVHGETAYTANQGITGRHGREILATDPASDEGAR
jgi:allantoinase